jgi:hypothetical protein
MRRPMSPPLLRGHEEKYIEIAKSPVTGRYECYQCGEPISLTKGEFYIFNSGNPRHDEHFGEPFRSQLASARRQSSKLSRPPAIGMHNLALKREHFRP